MSRLRACFTALWCALVALPTAAHEVRPAYLEIRESATGDIHILWKQPLAGERSIRIRPYLSSGWLAGDPTNVSATDTALHLEWHIPPPHASLAGQTIEIQGLDATLTDVLVSIRHADGSETSQVINGARPRLDIPSRAVSSVSLAHYSWLGITHIWSGADHLLYVFGLVLLVAAVRPLVLTLTSFTLAHSITLALTTLDLVRVPAAPVEAVIALSIVYLAVELLRQARGEGSRASAFPWLIAFPFGLLHGFGFAGALQEVGLPAGDIPAVLLLFNLGIEAGQIAFVLAVLSLAALARALHPFGLTATRKWAAYALGSIASFWVIGRMWPV